MAKRSAINMIRNGIFSTLIATASIFLIHCVQKPQHDAIINTKPNREIATSERQQPTEKLSFERCQRDRKFYLEDQIFLMSPEYFARTHEEDWEKKIPMRCIQFAQKNFQGRFAYCNTEDDKPRSKAPRPCLTEAYTTLVYNAYHDVKNCFNVDPKRSFIQLMIESGFHVNAVAPGRDAGISQMTKNGILRVMERNLLARTSNQLLTSSSPSCKRIASVIGTLDSDAFDLKKRCSVMSLPQNPYRSLVLHYLHTMRDKLYLESQLTEQIPEMKSILNDEILEQLSYFAYNRGITGTLTLLRGYIDSRIAVSRKLATAKVDGFALKTVDFNLWQNLSDARKIMRQEPEKREELKRRQIKNLSFAEYAVIRDKTYLAAMSEARDLVRARVGEGCF